MKPQTRVATNVAPAPTACEYCVLKLRPSQGCRFCAGTGFTAARFDLLESRTAKLRRVNYRPFPGSPAHGELLFGAAKSKSHAIYWEKYTVAEFTTDWKGRAFRVQKVARGDCPGSVAMIPEQGQEWHVYYGESESDRGERLMEVRCDCQGASYLSAARANEKAWHREGLIYPTYGCKHLDFVVALLMGGWFDLGVSDVSSGTGAGDGSHGFKCFEPVRVG